MGAQSLRAPAGVPVPREHIAQITPYCWVFSQHALAREDKDLECQTKWQLAEPLC
jgi:hypothetical protein